MSKIYVFWTDRGIDAADFEVFDDCPEAEKRIVSLQESGASIDAVIEGVRLEIEEVEVVTKVRLK